MVDMIQDDRDRGKKIFQRKERNWLGTISIPFSTLYRNLVVEGKFFLKAPIINFGYTEARPVNPNIENLQSFNEDAMLELYITLEPALPQPPALMPKVCYFYDHGI
jgi:hypothetical protein